MFSDLSMANFLWGRLAGEIESADSPYAYLEVYYIIQFEIEKSVFLLGPQLCEN